MTKDFKLILDTDIGDDIDDAFALTYACNMEPSPLIGVTTVFRNTAKRAKMAKAILASLGREDVPVYAGRDLPLHRGFENLFSPEVTAKETTDETGRYLPLQYDAAVMDGFGYEKKGAADYLIESAEKWGDKLVICAIGPLSNVAEAIERAPDTMKKIKQITIMGGWYHHNYGEWNIRCDPEAAQTVFGSGVPVYAVGIDVTQYCTLDKPMLARIAAAKQNTSRILQGMLDKWFKFFELTTPIMHDPLAVATLEGEFVDWEEVKVRVGTRNEETGCTFLGEGPVIYAATALKREAFLSAFAERIFKQK